MWRYATRRIAWMVPTLFVASLITFIGLSVIPGNIALLYLGDADRDEVDFEAYVADFEHRHGLDRPLLVRYTDWGLGILRGDPGDSMRTGQPIMRDVKVRLPVTLHISAFVLVFTAILGTAPGIIAAVKQDRWPDYVVRTLAIFADSFPNFFLFTLLLLLPAIWWGYGPPTGYEGPIWEHPWRTLRQFGPPTFIVGLGSAYLVRITRSSLLEVLRSDFVRTARAKGLRERTVLFRHSLRNSIIPVVTILGAVLAGQINGVVILENVMGLPGLGQYLFQAVQVRDFNVVQALTMYTAITLMMINLIVDLSYGFLDPRIRYE